MKAEYFPPREDVILQNEAPTDMYILVTGSVVSFSRYKFFCYCYLKFGESVCLTVNSWLQDLITQRNGVETVIAFLWVYHRFLWCVRVCLIF